MGLLFKKLFKMNLWHVTVNVSRGLQLTVSLLHKLHSCILRSFAKWLRNDR